MRNQRFPNSLVAYDQGYKDGIKAERERIAGEESDADPPVALTLDDVKRMSVEECIDHREEIDALLAGEVS